MKQVKLNKPTDEKCAADGCTKPATVVASQTDTNSIPTYRCAEHANRMLELDEYIVLCPNCGCTLGI